jgi:hypothetical protein
MKTRRFFILFLLIMISLEAKTQVLHLDLFECIQIASDSSLQAFRIKNAYQAGYWAYRSYKASRLPSVNMNLTPMQYNRNITQRYDYNENRDIYRLQQPLPIFSIWLPPKKNGSWQTKTYSL